MKRKLLIALGALFLFASAGTALAVTLPQGPALFETSLQSRISPTDTSMTLVANSVRGGGVLSGYNCFTVDEGRTDAEYICGQVSGTTVSSLERAVSPSNGTTTVTAIAYPHRVGADVKVTDFPLIERLRNLLNAAESFPSLLSYVTGTACIGTEPNGTICDKGYIDSRVVAGAANANETTKGIVEAGTQIEMASSTALGSTLASLFVQTKYSTSSPGTAGIWNVISQNNGKISPSFLNGTDNYTFNGITNHAGTTTVTGAGGLNVTASTTLMGTTTELGVTTINTLGQTFMSATTTTSWPLPIVVATSTGKVTTGSSLLASSTIGFIGFSQGGLQNGTSTFVQTSGIVSGFTGLTAGRDYYLQDNGSIGTSVGTLEAYVGTAISSTQLDLLPPRQLQYSGSISLGTAVPSYVRELVIGACGTSSGFSQCANMVVKNVGATSGTQQSVDFGGSSEAFGFTCSFTNATCVASATALSSITGTAYMYR